MTWGDLGGDSTAVQDQLTSGANLLNQGAFVALKDDGSVVLGGQQMVVKSQTPMRPVLGNH